MIIARRKFLGGLAALFGTATIDGLARRVRDRGAPILLDVPETAATLHVYEGGALTLGPYDDGCDSPRPTWRRVYRDQGIDIDDPTVLRRILDEEMSSEAALDEAVADEHWAAVWGTLYSPLIKAYRLMEDPAISARLGSRERGARRVDFHDANNHPGSWDLWCEARDDLTVSLIQARLIELKRPIAVVMEVDHVTRYD